MSWIEPLDLQTILINVLAGDATYFVAIAIFMIVTLSAFFRMTSVTLGFMVIVFFLMFSGYVPAELIVFVAVFAGLGIGYAISKIVKN